MACRVSDGLTYDIYQFESEQDAQTILGVVALGLDIFSFGALEIGHHRDITPAKQVAVAYDVQDRIAFVSKPWSVTTDGPCRRQRSGLPADSGVPATAHPDPMPGLSDLATVKSQMRDSLWTSMAVTFDGNEHKESVVELPPGLHEVSYCGIVATVELFSGRFYRLISESFVGYARYHPFIFIEDIDSGEILHCVPPYQCNAIQSK